MEELIKVTQLPIITEHLVSVKDSVNASVSQALSLVCTEETIATVKATRAELSKQFQQLEALRKDVKKAVFEPYEQFEIVYNDCVADAFKRADGELKFKIDDVENVIKSRCENGLREYFDELCAAEHLDFFRFEQAGIKIDLASAKQKTPKKLREQLKDFVAKRCDDMAMISQMPDADEIMVEYRQSLDINAALKAVSDRKRRREEMQAAQAERAAAQSWEAAAVKAVAEATPPPKVVPAAEEPEKVYKCAFTVRATKTKLKKLREFLEKEGIEYAR